MRCSKVLCLYINCNGEYHLTFPKSFPFSSLICNQVIFLNAQPEPHRSDRLSVFTSGTRHKVQFSSKTRRQSTSMSQSQNQCCVKHGKGMNAMPWSSCLYEQLLPTPHETSQPGRTQTFPVLIFLPHSSLQGSLLSFFSSSEIMCQRQSTLSKILSSFFWPPPPHLNLHYILSVCPPVCATMCSFV